MAENQRFSWKKIGIIIALSLLVGVGEYAVAWQFNDGNITQRVIGAVFIGMALPSLLFGGVMRIFKPELQLYFAISAGIFMLIGLILILT